MTNKSYKILFVIRATTHLHYYRSIIEALAWRGHQVHVLFGKTTEWWSGKEEYFKPVEEMEVSLGDNFSYEMAKDRKKDWRWWEIFYIRRILNYHHNLNVDVLSRYFRDRAIATFGFPLKVILKLSPIKYVVKQKFVSTLIRWLERKIPPDAKIVSHIQEIDPDVVLAPAGNLLSNSIDVEYTKAASYLGIATIIPVISWDFLTTKGTIHIMPDRLFCWNQFHAEEAIKYHNFPKDRIRITGSPMLDKWLKGFKSSLTMSEFCAKHGLRESDPIVVYLGSTPNVALDESWVVEELRDALDRSSKENLRNIQIVVRPHPVHYKIYEKVEKRGIAIIPKIGGMMPDNEESAQLFYDTLAHSVGVVGLNTSAMLDAMVMGSPCVLWLTEKYRARQRKTLYLQHLIQSEAAEIVRTSEECADVVGNLARGIDKSAKRRQAFIKEAVRPRGMDKTAGEAAAIEVENLLREKN